MSQVLICWSAVCMGAMAAYLVLDKRYEDGLVGRLALVLMAGTACLIFIVSWFEEADVPGALLAAFLLAAAVFMARHVYRYLRWRVCGEGDWRGSGK